MRNPNKALVLTVLMLGLWMALPAIAEDKAEEDYATKFQRLIKKVEPAPTLEEYATVARFDELAINNLDAALKGINNDESGLAWGTSYQMQAINEMYRVTRDVKYLRAAEKTTEALFNARDDKRNIALFTGQVAPIWSCLKYSERGRCVYPVHTGMIAYPILDFLLLAKDNPEYLKELGDKHSQWLALAQESLDFHNRQWRNEPTPDQGYYYGMDQEKVFDGKALPMNRLSSMGRALWISFKVSGNKEHEAKALAIGRYLKRRFSINTDHDAYVWAYQIKPASEACQASTADLRKKIGGGEDISHGSLTLAFPAMLAEDGVIFDKTDMERFARTFVELIAPDEQGFLRVNVDGDSRAKPDLSLLALPGRWLCVAPYNPLVYPRLLPFFLNWQPTPSALDIALLLKYKPSK